MTRAATVESVPEGIVSAMRASGVWQDSCPVPIERLSLIRIRYLDFDGKEKEDGEIIALDTLAEPIATIFLRLLKERFPIKKIRPVHEYGGADELSMADNNTSCFCFRPIAGSGKLSMHARGAALDINPLQNPYLSIDEENGVLTAYPKPGWQYVNRHNKKPGMVEDIVLLLAENGFFEWGGRWTTPIDYHHFQTPRWLAELLLALPLDDGNRVLAQAVDNRDRLVKTPNEEQLQSVKDLYRKGKSSFFDEWVNHLVT